MSMNYPDLELTFTCTLLCPWDGQSIDAPLMEDGRSRTVTEDNKVCWMQNNFHWRGDTFWSWSYRNSMIRVLSILDKLVYVVHILYMPWRLLEFCAVSTYNQDILIFKAKNWQRKSSHVMCSEVRSKFGGMIPAEVLLHKVWPQETWSTIDLTFNTLMNSWSC